MVINCFSVSVPRFIQCSKLWKPDADSRFTIARSWRLRSFVCCNVDDGPDSGAALLNCKFARYSARRVRSCSDDNLSQAQKLLKFSRVNCLSLSINIPFETVHVTYWPGALVIFRKACTYPTAYRLTRSLKFLVCMSDSAKTFLSCVCYQEVVCHLTVRCQFTFLTRLSWVGQTCAYVEGGSGWYLKKELELLHSRAVVDSIRAVRHLKRCKWAEDAHCVPTVKICGFGCTMRHLALFSIRLTTLSSYSCDLLDKQ